MHSMTRLEDQIREQETVMRALEAVVADGENVTLCLGDEIREQLDEVVDRLETTKQRARVPQRAIRI
jgi:uncharacterized coiled-coil protein SlyX